MIFAFPMGIFAALSMEYRNISYDFTYRARNVQLVLSRAFEGDTRSTNFFSIKRISSKCKMIKNPTEYHFKIFEYPSLMNPSDS